MRYCVYCGKIITSQISFSNLFRIPKDYFCVDCMNKLEKVEGGCVRCGRKTEDTICSDCLFWEHLSETKDMVIKNTSSYYYNTFAKEFIRQMKFLGDLKLLLGFQKEIKHFFKHHQYEDYLLIPVPLHEDRLKERGFNQSLYIAKLIGLPVLDILEKLDNERQSKKTRKERLTLNNQYRFKAEINLKGMSILIVDDIYTTGATIHKIARLFFDKGVKDLQSFTLFRS